MPKPPTNDQVLVEEIVKQRHKENAPEMRHDEYFEIFVSEQILKNQDLEYDELIDGIVGGGRDGGIDSFYIFINGEHVREDFDFSASKQKPTVDVVIIQSKTSKRFEETAIEKIKLLLADALNLSLDLSSLEGKYNAELISKLYIFNSLARSLASKFPRFRFQLAYVALGDEKSRGLLIQADEVVSQVLSFTRDTEARFDIFGATELLDLIRTDPKSTFSLTLTEQPISHDDGKGFIGLASLPDYFGFITDENGDLRRGIFEDNVRDYQGSSVEVNKAIQDTLSNATGEDFWWLNNGVTIVSDDATATGKIITVENPQIVNGLQTSTEIFNYLSRASIQTRDNDYRSVLIRILVPREEEIRDRVIKATNSQTGVQISSLRSTDRIHRNIEQYLRDRSNLFYDRKKNFYKNQGRPLARIVSVSQMAQAVMSTLLRQPDTARARPSSLLKDDQRYSSIFDEKLPLGLYLVSARLLKSIEAMLSEERYSLASKDRNNVRFYAVMAATHLLCGSSSPTAHDIAQLEQYQDMDAQLRSAIETALSEYDLLGRTDTAAKGTVLKANLEKNIATRWRAN